MNEPRDNEYEDIQTTLNQDYPPRDGPIILFHVRIKQHSPLHQGQKITWIEDNILYNRSLSDVVFQARS